MRELTEADVEFSIIAEEEDIPIRGSFDSGDAKDDEDMVQEIERDLAAGNEWAWCCVKVTGRWSPTEDVTLEAYTYLGACSYKSRRDFIECNDYAKDMREEVLAELNKQLIAWTKALDTLTVPCVQGTEGDTT